MRGGRLLNAYVIPICVYQSVAIAGGYGTGREVVEYFTSSGIRNGLRGLLVASLLMAIITALTFEYARLKRAYDYRTFFRSLIGRFWIGFEACYMVLFLISVAVVGSAAGTLLSLQIGMAENTSLMLMLLVIGALAYYGREVIERVMVFLAILLFIAFGFYFYSVHGNNIGANIHPQVGSADKAGSHWFMHALQFAFYSSPIAPCVLFATRGIATRGDAIGCGALCGLIFMLPGLLFHLSFIGVMPAVLTQKVPVYWLIEQLDAPMLMPIYVVAMLGTFVGTATGFIQGVNERLDYWAQENGRKALSPWMRLGVAVSGFTISALLGQFGIIVLIAKGYGTVAWGFLILFILPMLTIGVYRIFVRVRNDPAIVQQQ